MRVVGLLLAGACVVTLGIAYAATRPGAEAAREVGAAPVRVVEKPRYKAQRLGRVARLPALAERPAPPKRAPTRVEPAKRRRSVPVEQPQRVAAPSEPYVAPPASVTPPAPPAPPPSPVYEPAPPPPPSPPPSPSPEPEVVTFDDSG
jgi:hypothetical protein